MIIRELVVYLYSIFNLFNFQLMSDQLSPLPAIVGVFSPNNLSMLKNIKTAAEQIGNLAERFTSEAESYAEAIVKVRAEYAELEARNNANIAAFQTAKDAITKEIAEQKRIAKLDLELSVKADREAAMVKIAQEMGLVVLTPADLNDRDAKITALTAEVGAIRGKTEGIMKAQFASELKEVTASTAAQTAQLQANYNAAQSQIDFLNKQIEDLRNQLKSTMATAEAMVAAATKPVTITNAGGR